MSPLIIDITTNHNIRFTQSSDGDGCQDEVIEDRILTNYYGFTLTSWSLPNGRSPKALIHGLVILLVRLLMPTTHFSLWDMVGLVTVNIYSKMDIIILLGIWGS